MSKYVFILFFLMNSLLFADYVEIGTGTGTTPNQGPFYNYYKNNRTQTLYLSNELPGACFITKFSFNIANVADNQYMQLPNFSVKILPTSDTQLSTGSFYNMTNATEVFSSSSYLLASQTGWTDIEIEDYLYNGSDNLIIEINWGQLSSYAPYDDYCLNLKTTTPGVTRMLYGYDDSTTPAPYNSSADAYSNIRVHYYPQEGYPEQPFNPYPENGEINIATTAALTWDFGADTETYDLYFGTQNPPTQLVINDEVAEGTGFYQPEEMENITTYYWRVIARNSNRHEVSGPVWSFTTAYPAGVVAVTVGDGTTLEERIPLCFYYKNSLTQTIYTAQELNTYGLITNIQYYYNFTSTLYDKPIKIWMGETGLNDLETDWIPASDLTLVFQGNVDYYTGENMIDIELTSDFLYENDNLIVMVQRPWDNTNYSQNDQFYITEDTNSEHKTRYNRDNFDEYDPFNPPEPSYTFGKYPNTTFYFQIGGLGAIDGYVTDENEQPIAQALVRCESTQQFSYSNQSGYYYLGSLPLGEHSFSASKFGYEDLMITAEIEEDVTTELNFQLEPLGILEVHGLIVGSDFPDIGLADAEIVLSGIQTYNAVSDDNGEFTISNVYLNQTYNITISHENYAMYQDEIEVTDSDLGSFVLEEITMPPGNIFASQNEEESILQLNWNSPGQGGTQFRYDDSQPVFQIGYGNLPNAIFGAVHRNIAIVQEISWYLTSMYGEHPSVKLFIFGLNENGEPDNSQLLYQSQLLVNTDDEWNSYELTSPIECWDGFFVGVNTPNLYTSIALDDGIGEPWVFQEETHYAINDWTNSSAIWVDIGSETIFRKNMLLRASGINLGNLEENKSTTRAFESYNVYRFLSYQQNNPQTWEWIASSITDTTFTDENWGAMPQGEYQFAVTSVHTNTVESMPAFSNTIWKTTTNSDETTLPNNTMLGKNYPNPFNPETTITFSLASKQPVTLEIFNIKGEKVKVLVDKTMMSGAHDVQWKGLNSQGKKVSSGMYFYRMKTNDYEKIEKMILLK